MNYRVSIVIPPVVLSILIMLACGGPKSQEDRIRALINEAGNYAEKKDLSGLMGLFSDDYSDFRKRDKSQTRALVQSYLNHYRSIVVHMLSTRFEEIDPLKASIQTDVAVSSGAAKAFRKLIPLSTDIYRFRFEFIRGEDRWLIRYAEWRPIGLQELFPESLAILKKIFPDG